MCSGYFRNAQELAMEVLAALRVHESSRLAQQLEAFAVMHQAQELGPSYMVNIKDKLKLIGKVPFIALHLGPEPWWNTRLYLVAMLAREFDSVRGLVFIDDKGEFILMAEPREICFRLAMRWPELKEAYNNFRHEADTLERVEEELWRYSICINNAFGKEEQTAQHTLNEHDIGYTLGILRNAEIVELEEKGQRFLQREILGRQTAYVALVRKGKLEKLVDRQMLANRVAQAALL
jgi:hypothetical protein